jgi:hypothetical protein
MDRGSYINSALVERTTFAELILRYLQEVTPKKKVPGLSFALEL